MNDILLSHPFDLDSETDDLDLFAEEVRGGQRHDLPPNSLSTLGCECDISTFFCYGCGVEDSPVESPANFETALKWTRDKMNARAENDKAAEVIQTLFKSVKAKT
jgi:hypothetical protein